MGSYFSVLLFLLNLSSLYSVLYAADKLPVSQVTVMIQPLTHAPDLLDIGGADAT